MKVVVAHPGTQYAGKLAAQLHRNGVLDALHTGFSIAEGGMIDRVISILPNRARRALANRRISGLPAARLRLHPADEAVAFIEQRIGRSQQSIFYTRNRRFQKRVATRALAGADAVIGFDTSGWILAERCSRLGVPFLLDQSIGHAATKSRVFEQLRGRYPAWSHDTEPRLARVSKAESIEHSLANRIVVPSLFVRDTLAENGVPIDKIRVNAFGVDSARFSPAPRRSARPFRFCFVGSITVRKGVPLLLDAWRSLNAEHAELWLVGPAHSSVVGLLQGHRNVVFRGAVPNSELPGILNQCDVFVFPSFFEGFAQVIPEAMACALPAIVTTAAGADVIQDGFNGWVIPPGDQEALTRLMARCLSSPREVAEVGSNARRAAEGLSWERYGERWMQILREVTHDGTA